MGSNYFADRNRMSKTQKAPLDPFNSDITYCMATDCRHPECERHPEQWKGRTGIASFSDFSGVCRLYITDVVDGLWYDR